MFTLQNMVKLCLYGNTGTTILEKTLFGTCSQGVINHFFYKLMLLWVALIQRKIFGLKGSFLATCHDQAIEARLTSQT